MTETLNADAVSSVKVNEFTSSEGESFTGVTLKDIFEVLDADPSFAVSVRLPKVFNVELAFSSDEKEILESCDAVSSVPAAKRTPSEVVRVKPVGIESTVIVSVPDALVGDEIEKVPGVSSSKVND
jgi:hypothetical protein